MARNYESVLKIQAPVISCESLSIGFPQDCCLSHSVKCKCLSRGVRTFVHFLVTNQGTILDHDYYARSKNWSITQFLLIYLRRPFANHAALMQHRSASPSYGSTSAAQHSSSGREQRRLMVKMKRLAKGCPGGRRDE